MCVYTNVYPSYWYGIVLYLWVWWLPPKLMFVARLVLWHHTDEVSTGAHVIIHTFQSLAARVKFTLDGSSITAHNQSPHGEFERDFYSSLLGSIKSYNLIWCGLFWLFSLTAGQRFLLQTIKTAPRLLFSICVFFFSFLFSFHLLTCLIRLLISLCLDLLNKTRRHFYYFHFTIWSR